MRPSCAASCWRACTSASGSRSRSGCGQSPERRATVARLKRLEQRVVGEPGLGWRRRKCAIHRRLRAAAARRDRAAPDCPRSRSAPSTGEPSAPVGPSGSTCHTLKPAARQPVDEGTSAAPERRLERRERSSTPARRRSNTGRRALKCGRALQRAGATHDAAVLGDAAPPAEIGSASAPGGTRPSRR